MAARADGRAAASNPYSGGGAGGKLRVSRRGNTRKSTPYDRPASARHAPSDDCLPIPSASSPSIKSRLVNTASRLITSSASFLFSSILGRRSLQISAGRHEEPVAAAAAVVAEEVDDGVAIVESSTEEQDAEQESEETACSLENAEPPTPQFRADAFVGGGDSGTTLEVRGQSSVPQEKELDLFQVEGMLKEKTLSREQVDRLTGILQDQVAERNPSRTQVAGKPANNSRKDSFAREEEEEEAALAPVTEAQRWREELKRARMDLTPIEVARAYMGEKTSMPARWRSLSLRGVDHQSSKVTESQPYRGLLEDNNWASPMLRSSVRTAIRPMKPTAVVDEGWMSVGPVRRARQRVSRAVNQSPYARGLFSRENTTVRANVSPPMQSSHTARKILDTLEKLSPSPKGRLLDGDLNLAVAGERTPFGLNTDRYNSGRYPQEVSRFSNLRGASSNGRLDFESMGQTPIRLLSEDFNAAKQELTAHEKVPFKSVAALPGLDTKLPVHASEIPSFSKTAATVLTSAAVNVNPFSIAVGSATASISQVTKEDSVETVKKPFSSILPSAPSNISSSLGSFGTSIPVSTTQLFGKPNMPASTTSFTLPVAERVEDIKERNEHRDSEASVLSNSKTTAAGGIFSFASQTDVSATGSVSLTKIAQSSATAQFGFATSSSTATGSSFPFPFSSPIPTSEITSSNTLPPLGISTNTSFTFSPPAFAPVSCSTPTFSFGGSNGMPNFGSTLTSSAAPFGSKIAPTFGSNSAAPVFGSATNSLAPTFGSNSAAPVFGSATTSLAPTFGSNSAAPVFGSATTSLSSSTSISGTCSASASDVVISSEAVSTSAPVFSFRSPSGDLEVSDIGSTDASFSEPTFTFGSGAPPSVSVTSIQTPACSLPFSGPQVGFGVFGSTTGSGSAALPTLKVVTSPPQVPFELTGGFASGPGGLEKSGRKFIKAKRRK